MSEDTSADVLGNINMDNSPQYVWRRVFRQILKLPYLSRFLSDWAEIENLSSFYECEE